MSARRLWLHGEHGAAALEFALVLPILVMLVMGIVEFSRAYSAKEALQHAVRDGARELALRNDPATIEQVVRNNAIGLPASNTIAVSISSDEGVTFTTASGASPPCPADPAVGDAATVRASYNLPYNIPLFSSGTWTLTATGAMRCNG